MGKSFWKPPLKVAPKGVVVESESSIYRLWYDGEYYFYWKLGNSIPFAYRKIGSLYDLDDILTELSIGYTFGELNRRLEEVGLKIPLDNEACVMEL